jgi:uncharacterized protein (TIGR02996 family)
VEDEAFVRALAEHPDDEHLRLVYADWLEECNDPRGELLRLEGTLRSIPIGDAQRQPLGRRWRELRATLDPDWLGRIDPNLAIPRWLSPAGGPPARSGVLDYYRWMSNNHWEWVILAVLAPIEQVARTLVECRARSDPDSWLSSRRWLRGVPVRTGREYDPVSSLLPLVQLRGHAWTVAVYDTFNLSMGGYVSAQGDARELSDRLGTVAVEFSTEDTSGATGYHLYECGGLAEFAEWDSASGRFASRKRPRPPWTGFPRDYPDELFRECGLYIPSFYARDDRDQPCLALDVPPPEAVERADLIDLRGSFDQRGYAALQQLRSELPQVHVLGDELEEGRPLPPDFQDEDDIPF